MFTRPRRVLLSLVVLVAVVFGIVLIGQILQLSDFASRINPTFGQVVFWILTGTLSAMLLVPLLLLLRLPSALKPPPTDEGPAFDRHLQKLRRRLSANPILEGAPLATKEDIVAALSRLDERANAALKQAASRAFLATAVSQNGALDALTVLALHARLVWSIASVYSQRPAPAEFVRLYANVVITAYLAGEIEDIVQEATTAALAPTLGTSLVGSVPGMQAATNVVVSSVLSGTANAFATLRVGLIARDYSRAWIQPQRGTLRRNAARDAGPLLGEVVASGSTRILKMLPNRAGKAVTDAVTATGEGISSVGNKLGEAVAGTGKTVKEAATGTGKAVAGAVSSVGKVVRSSSRRKPDSTYEDGEPNAS